ncbi:MAG: hypothetical protein AAFV19_08865 [Pseudomonadota bacterium]
MLAHSIGTTFAKYLVVGGLVAGLAACGSNPTDRALTGAALGASVGVAGAALTKNDLGPAALVGGLLGAAAGGLTTRDQIDIGEPVYREPIFGQ